MRFLLNYGPILLPCVVEKLYRERSLLSWRATAPPKRAWAGPPQRQPSLGARADRSYGELVITRVCGCAPHFWHILVSIFLGQVLHLQHSYQFWGCLHNFRSRIVCCMVSETPQSGENQ